MKTALSWKKRTATCNLNFCRANALNFNRSNTTGFVAVGFTVPIERVLRSPV